MPIVGNTGIGPDKTFFLQLSSPTGGANLGSHPYTVTARFANVVDLVPQSAVRVNDVAVGRVSRIYLPPHSWTADVTMVINGDVRLSANADARP